VNVRQRQAAATRQQLLTAACEVFEEEGYTATSVGAITDRANTAHGTFYLYFRNKEHAFCEVMKDIALNELVKAMRTSDDVPLVDRVEPVIRGFLHSYRAHARLWRAVLQASLLSDKVRDLWMELRQVAVSQVAALLEAEAARGACRPLDPSIAASALASMTEGYAFVHFALQEPSPEGGESGGPGEPGEATERSSDNDNRDGVGDVDHAANVLLDLWRHAVYGRLPV
jgi:AcrR family transcriptional regulator